MTAADFFAHDPFPPAEPYVDPAPSDECRFLHCARWLVDVCLSGQILEWRTCPEFLELCALLGMSPETPADDDLRPDIPLRYRPLRASEIIEAGDKWRPWRRRPATGRLTLPFETVPAEFAGVPVSRCPVRAVFIRAVKFPEVSAE